MSEKNKISWSHIHLHQIMLEDERRTAAYKKAIKNSVRKNDIAIDIGCGMGILSYFAAQNQCKKVYAVDNSEIIQTAKQISTRNDFDKKIKFIQKDILKFKPNQKLDILIHEQIGGFLWEEDCIKKVSYVRDNCLKKNGRILPLKIELYFAPSCAYSDFHTTLNFWAKKHHNIDFSVITEELFAQNYKKAFFPSIIQLQNTNTFLAKPQKIYTLDFTQESRLPKKLSTNFSISKTGRLNGMCGFMKIFLDKDTTITTAPKPKNTHWGQMFLPNPKTRTIKKGDTLTFRLTPNINPLKWIYSVD